MVFLLERPPCLRSYLIANVEGHQASLLTRASDPGSEQEMGFSRNVTKVIEGRSKEVITVLKNLWEVAKSDRVVLLVGALQRNNQQEMCMCVCVFMKFIVRNWLT